MSDHVYDVAVVGAGPAGSTTAGFFAYRGARVALLDRATFPRRKACAEYLSPEASRVLDKLGVLATLTSQGAAALAGMRVISPNGTEFAGRFAGAQPFRGFSDHGLALPREVLDTELVRAAVRRGAELRERAVVEGIEEGPGHRVLVVRGGSERRRISARLVIGADGIQSRIARQLGLARRGKLRRIALVAHASGVSGMRDLGEMYVGRAGYVGFAPVGKGLTNVAVVFDPDLVTSRARREVWLHHVIEGFPEAAARMRGAALEGPVLAAGPFAHTTVRATADRVMLVGDAADFYDPFTGEGIYAALRGAELAYEHAKHLVDDDRLAASDLAPYDTARHEAFGGKWKVERVIGWAVRHPVVMDRVARRLAARQSLADLLVGVTGDFVPAAEVLKPSFLLRLLW